MSKLIAHYADPNYDPIKAHEYYLRVRELKGRKKEDDSEERKAAELSKMQAENEKNKNAELGKLGPGDKDAKVKSEKTKAVKAKGDALRQKLTTTVKKDQAQKEASAIAERLRLEKEKQTKLDALPPIPNNISTAQRAILFANRQKEIAKIVAEYDALYEKTTVKPLDAKEKQKQKTKSTKKKAALKDLKDKVNSAKESYEEAQKRIKEKYDKQYSENYEKILLKYAK